MRQRMLIVVPPHAASMGNGPPLAPFLIQHHLKDSNIHIQFFDANACFFQWLLQPELREEVRQEELRRIEQYLQKNELTSQDLTALGRLITYLYSNYSQNLPFSFARSGIEWAGVSDLLLSTPPENSSNDWQSRIWQEGHILLVEQILARAPDHVAFSMLFHTQVRSAVAICKGLRQRGFTGRLVLGGSVIKLSQDAYLKDVLANSGADIAFTSNLYSNPNGLCSYICGEISASDVKGGAFLQETRMLQRQPRDFNVQFKLPGPLSFESVDISLYQTERVFPVLLSEGCYWGDCEFCDYPYLAAQNDDKNSVLFRQPQDVVADIVTVYEKYGVCNIDLVSDAVPLTYFRRLKQQGLIKSLPVVLGCSIRAEPWAREEFFEDMAASKVNSITIGVESVCDDVLAGMKKGNTYKDTMRVLHFAKEHGITVKANMIYDYPRMTIDHVKLTLERMEEIAPYIDSIGIHSFGLTPHAPVALNPRSANLRILGNSNIQTDHGEHCLPFERIDMTSALADGIKKLYEEMTALSFNLEMNKADENLPVRTLALPFEWHNDKAKRNTESPSLMIQIPGKRSPFTYYVGEYVTG
jgi:radical SAM family protein